MVEALEVHRGAADLSNVNEYEIADVTMNLRGVEYHTAVMNDFLSLTFTRRSRRRRPASSPRRARLLHAYHHPR
jgi:hypothetical protein